MRYALALLPLALAACGAPPTAPFRLAEDATAPAYEPALAAWTRKGETYEYFESRVFVRATLFSPAFAASFATRRAQRLGMSPTEARAERAGLVSRAGEEVRFFAAVVTNDPFWNDLDRGEKATLRARLMANGEAIVPTAVQRLTDDELADMAPFFPYADPLSRGYWIIFPASPEGEDIHLRISGPPAIVNLRWRVE